MAFYNNQNEEDQDNAQGMNTPDENQSQSGQPIQLSSQSSTISPSGIGTQPSAPKAPKPAASGTGPGFQNYAKANAGKAQDSLNSAAAQGVQNQGQMAKNSINQATAAFGQKVDQGSLANRQNALQDVQQAITSARNISAGGAVDQAQQDRFKEVINTQYAGPESLRQAGLYNQAAATVDKAQNTLNNTKTSTGREELLKQMFSQRGDYTTGLNKLDSALLNASQQGVQNLQNVAAQQGNLAQNLDKAQVASANLVQNRIGELNTIKQQARDAFTAGKTAEEAATEGRLDKVIQDWDKLPNYFKELITTANSPEKIAGRVNEFKSANNYGQIASTVSGLETQMAALEKELAKQQNLNAALAGTGEAGQANPATLAAIKSTRAKLQTAQAQKAQLDSQINALQNSGTVMLSPEEAAFLGVGSGEGLYNLGANAIATANAERDRLISKDEQARQAALSQLAGLDLSNLLSTNLKYDNAERAGTQTASDAIDLARTRELLNQAEQGFRSSADRTITGTGSKKNKTSGKTYYASETANLKNLLKKAGYDFNAPIGEEYSSNEDVMNAIANGTFRDVSGNPEGVAAAADATLGRYMNAGDGESLASTGLDLFTNSVAPAVNLLGGALGLGSVGGAFGGSNSKASKAKAQESARKDLNNKIEKALDSAGFENRFAVSDNQETRSRLAALQSLLANLDKTNA